MQELGGMFTLDVHPSLDPSAALATWAPPYLGCTDLSEQLDRSERGLINEEWIIATSMHWAVGTSRQCEFLDFFKICRSTYIYICRFSAISKGIVLNGF